MKRLLLFTLAMLLSMTATMAASKSKKADAETDIWRYEVSQRHLAKQGYILLEVWSYSAKPSIAAAQACKNAVHAIVYKGAPAGDANTISYKPLLNAADLSPESASYLKEFFAPGGLYMSFVTLTSNGIPGKTAVLKVSNKEYKVGVLVEVNYAQLRKAFESKGLVKGLKSGF